MRNEGEDNRRGVDRRVERSRFGEAGGERLFLDGTMPGLAALATQEVPGPDEQHGHHVQGKQCRVHPAEEPIRSWYRSCSLRPSIAQNPRWFSRVKVSPFTAGSVTCRTSPT